MRKKKKLSGWGKKRHVANNLQNGGCGRQNEFQSFSTTSVNGSLSNYDGLCLLEERKNLGQCRVRFVLSQESFPWRIHCLRWTRGVCALCKEFSLYGFRQVQLNCRCSPVTKASYYTRYLRCFAISSESHCSVQMWPISECLIHSLFRLAGLALFINLSSRNLGVLH